MEIHKKQHGGQNKKPDLTQDQLRKIEELAKIGATQKMMAILCDMSEATFERKIKEDPRLAEALSRGDSEGKSAVLKTAWAMAQSGKVPAMTMFYLKTRLRWSEARDTPPTEEERKAIEMNYKK